MIEVVGIGDDGWVGLPPRTQEMVLSAPVLVGGSRHLAQVPESDSRRCPWPSPLLPHLREFMTDLGPDVVVLASGDPLRSGIATALITEFGRECVRVEPWISSDTLARARMGWAAEDVDVITLVGRSPQRLRPFLTPGARLVVLCSDGSGPAHLAQILGAEGAGSAVMTAWWHLGGAGEGSRSATADQWDAERTPDLVVVCLELPAEMTATHRRGPVPGRSDEAFEHDGLITKRDVRASALARLRPMPGQLLWDLGAGSGAVGMEWCLAAPNSRAIAVERDDERADRIERNATAWGLDHRVQVVRAETESAIEQLNVEQPDAVFLGGGICEAVIEHVVRRLRLGGRLVAHAVTVESEQMLLAAHQRHGGELVRLGVEHLEELGRFQAWKPARPITSWSIVKGEQS